MICLTFAKAAEKMVTVFERDHRMKNIKIFMLVAAVAIVSACSTGKAPTTERVRTAAFGEPERMLLTKLSASAAIIEQSAREQRMMEAAIKMPDISENQYRNFVAAQAHEPDELKYEISMPKFNGPAEKIVLGIANAVGWSFGTEGNQPPVPDVVSKEYSHQRAIDALKDISYSVDTMDVVVDAVNKRIVVRYKGQ